MKASTARMWTREWARNAGSSAMYTDMQVDQAMQAVFTRFCRVTKAVKVTSTLTLTASSAELPTLPTGFRPSCALAAWLSDDDQTDLTIVDFQELRYQRREETEDGSVPQYLGFDTATTGEVYPTPGTGYSLYLHWWQPFTVWAAGSVLLATGTSTVAAGAVTAVAVNSPGGRFTIAPTITFSGGGGTNAAATATINADGQVTSVTVTNGGSGYTSAPTVTFVYAGAIADPTLDVPDDWLAEILPHGPPAMLQHNEVEHAYASAGWQEYLRIERGLAGQGLLGATRAERHGL